VDECEPLICGDDDMEVGEEEAEAAAESQEAGTYTRPLFSST